jgi:hypothetical protein
MKPNEAKERKRMDNSKIHEALMAVQSELKAPKGQMNKFGGYKYRSCEDILEAVKPILKAHSLVLRLSDKPVIVDSWHYIEATATVESQDGATYTVTAYAREPEFKKGMDDSQITGTASSYARKYALNGLFCIDDTKDADTDEYQKQTTSRSNKPEQKQTEAETIPHALAAESSCSLFSTTTAQSLRWKLQEARKNALGASCVGTVHRNSRRRAKQCSTLSQFRGVWFTRLKLRSRSLARMFARSALLVTVRVAVRRKPTSSTAPHLVIRHCSFPSGSRRVA